MDIREQNILFFTRTMELGGTENVVLQLCEIFQPITNKIVVCSCGGVNVDKLSSMGIHHYEIPDIENKSFKVMLKTARELQNIVKKEKITVIHTHHRMAAFYVSALGLYRKSTFINTSHNTFYDKKALTRFAYKNAYLITCGDMVKKNLTEFFGLPDGQITVIHNAVKPFNDENTIDSTIEELHKQGYILIGNVGRLSEQKGMSYFIEAIAIIHNKCPQVRFLIVGTGDEEIKLKNQAENLGISDVVIFMGYRSDIQNLMSQLDLIVLSSLWEGLPLTPIEAFSVGKTIVATAVDGTLEIVKDGINGLLVEPQNSEQIAQAVCALLSDPGKRKTFETNAKQTFEDSFSYDVFSQKYISAYEEI